MWSIMTMKSCMARNSYSCAQAQIKGFFSSQNFNMLLDLWRPKAVLFGWERMFERAAIFIE